MQPPSRRKFLAPVTPATAGAALTYTPSRIPLTTWSISVDYTPTDTVADGTYYTIWDSYNGDTSVNTSRSWWRITDTGRLQVNSCTQGESCGQATSGILVWTGGQKYHLVGTYASTSVVITRDGTQIISANPSTVLPTVVPTYLCDGARACFDSAADPAKGLLSAFCISPLGSACK